MKTTLELPDDLARRVKVRAVQQDQKLKDTIAQLIEIGLSQAPELKRSGSPPKPARLDGRGPLTFEEIDTAIGAGRD